jgi:endonuclease/exonuclease/phosphatase (EEP) superfamily protein YafD
MNPPSDTTSGSDQSSATEPSRHPIWGVHPLVSKVAFIASVSGTTALLILYLVLGDRTWWSECITLWPPFLWAAALLLPSLVTIDVRRPRRTLIAFGLLAVFLGTTAEWRSLVRRGDASLTDRFEALRAEPEPAGNPLAVRVAAWNIASYKSRKADVLDALARFDPDLCFLQEIPQGSGAIGPSDLTGVWAGHHWIGEGDCGLLSRFPLHVLPPMTGDPARSPQMAVVDLPGGRRAIVASVHLIMPTLAWDIFFRQTVPFPRGHRMRLSQYDLLTATLRERMEEEGIEAVIVAGDYNVSGFARSLAPLRRALRDVWPECGLGWGGTFPSPLPLARLDQCWVSPDVQAVAARVHGGRVSDHRMLVADLIIP